MRTEHIAVQIQSIVYGSVEGKHSSTIYSANWPRGVDKTMGDQGRVTKRNSDKRETNIKENKAVTKSGAAGAAQQSGAE